MIFAHRQSQIIETFCAPSHTLIFLVDAQTTELFLVQSRPAPDDNDRLLGTMREKQRRLALVDILLWGTKPGNEQGRPPGKRAGWFAAILHAVLTLSMNAVSLKATKMEFTMFQDTVPGPWQPHESAVGAVLPALQFVGIQIDWLGPLL